MNNRSWRKIQIRIKERDHWKCQKCFSDTNLCVHHIDLSGGEQHHIHSNNNDDNLLTLCASCHTKEHWKFTKEKGASNIYEAFGERP